MTIPAQLAEHLPGVFAGFDAGGIVSAYLFGSQAEGRAHRESDVDIGVILDRRVHPDTRRRFEARLQLTARAASALHADRVDLIVLNDAPPTLARAVFSRGQRVFCSDAEADREFQRTTLLRAADLEPFLRRTRAAKLDRLRQ